VRFLQNAPSPPEDDCRDTGGRVTQGAVTEGWGEGIEKDNSLILITLILAIPHKWEGFGEFCKNLEWHGKESFIH
jgi:hypothetical protein